MSKAPKSNPAEAPQREPTDALTTSTLAAPTARDRQVAEQLAREAAAVATKEMEHRKVIERCKGLLAVLASIQPNAPGYGAVYDLYRMGQRGRIRPGDIERAALCLADRVGNPARPATVADCIEALTPLARMPRDPLSEDANAVQFSFPSSDGKGVQVTLGMIREADALVAQYGD